MRGESGAGSRMPVSFASVLVAEIFGFAAAIQGVLQGWPQARKVRTLGHSTGVSLVMWVMMTASSAAWLGYGIRTESPSLVASTLATGFINANVVIAISNDRAGLAVRMVPVFVTVTAGAALLPGWIVTPILFFFTLSRVPQVARSWKTRRLGGGTTAVSFVSNALSIGCLLCWMVYSVLLASPTLIGTTSIALILNLVVVWLEVSNRSAAERSAAPSRG